MIIAHNGITLRLSRTISRFFHCCVNSQVKCLVKPLQKTFAVPRKICSFVDSCHDLVTVVAFYASLVRPDLIWPMMFHCFVHTPRGFLSVPNSLGYHHKLPSFLTSLRLTHLWCFFGNSKNRLKKGRCTESMWNMKKKNDKLLHSWHSFGMPRLYQLAWSILWPLVSDWCLEGGLVFADQSGDGK